MFGFLPKTHLLLLLGISGLVLQPGCDKHSSEERNNAQVIQSAHSPIVGKALPRCDAFGIDLYQQLSRQAGNLCFSPLSIQIALAMTGSGSEGVTEDEIAKTIRLDLRDKSVHQRMEDLQLHLAELTHSQSFDIRIANRLWGNDSFKFGNEFSKITRDHYSAAAKHLNFGETEKARNTINDWVAEKTEYRIAELLPEGSLSPTTQLVLTNALFFKGKWQLPFNEKRTREGSFFVRDDDSVNVELMRIKDEFRYGEFGDKKIIQLPYGEGELSMFVLLPESPEAMQALESQLDLKKLKEWTSQLERQRVDVTLPKFKVRSDAKLVAALQAIGIQSAFDAEKADFSGITDSSGLSISDVIHQSEIEVSESGTEASAATAVLMNLPSAANSKTREFRADHPFIFIIGDPKKDVILFMGRLNNPS